MIQLLLSDNEASIRYGGVYAIMMAYVGTGSHAQLRKLLHLAVSDVNDDVRRAAVTAIGFVLCRNGAQVPKMVHLLSESYNPDVRYGAAMALGVACAASGNQDAMDIIDVLLVDTTDYVRQGALIAGAMILQ